METVVEKPHLGEYKNTQQINAKCVKYSEKPQEFGKLWVKMTSVLGIIINKGDPGPNDE